MASSVKCSTVQSPAGPRIHYTVALPGAEVHVNRASGEDQAATGNVLEVDPNLGLVSVTLRPDEVAAVNKAISVIGKS